MKIAKRMSVLVVICLAFGSSATLSFANEKQHFARGVAKKVNQTTYGTSQKLVCSERRSVSNPDEILKTWTPDFAKVSRLSSNKAAFAKMMTAFSIASSTNNLVLFRVELSGNTLLSSHCLLAQSEKTATYFAKNFHVFHGWGRSKVNAPPYKFHFYELRKPFRDVLKRMKVRDTEIYWNLSVHPQQVFVPAN